MTEVFWLSVGLIAYAYAGYPLALWALSMFRRQEVVAADIEPRVTVVIAARNEHRRIAAKLENTLGQDYPGERLQLIVASDASTDDTERIVERYAGRGVQLVRANTRLGKEGVQRLGLRLAEGEIIVFSDVATLLDREGIRTVVRSFNDPTVGCVSSVDRVLDPDGKPSGEGAYVRYEMLLRRLESRVSTLVGLSGSFFAARRRVCEPWPTDLQSDFNTVLNAVRAGLRGVLDERSVGFYTNIADESREYERKVRTVLRGMTVLWRQLPLLNPLRYGLFAWQLASHKLCRWLVPVAMATAFASNAMLVEGPVPYRFLFAAQGTFYLWALVGLARYSSSASSFLRIPAYFVLVNASILTAWYRFVRGDRMATWEPSVRS